MHHSQLTAVLLCSIMLVAFQSQVSARPAPVAYAVDSDDRYPHLQKTYRISQSAQRRRARHIQYRWGAYQTAVVVPSATTRTRRARSYIAVERYGEPYLGSSPQYLGYARPSERRTVRRSRAGSPRQAVERKKSRQQQTTAAAPSNPSPAPKRQRATKAPRVAAATRPTTVITEARRYLGTNPTRMSRLWCARFMNMVLERTGHRGTGSDMARSFASYGTRVSGPRVGAIAVLARGRRGGHVGVVTGFDARGNPILISGNHNRVVAEAPYPRSSIFAYVMPVSKSAPVAATELSTAAKQPKAAAAAAPADTLPDWSDVASAVATRDSIAH